MQAAPKLPVPVFPLPDIVLFPHAVIPLHVFELRYRTMVRDALSGERLIAMALLKPGWEADERGNTDFFPVGCLAHFQEVQWLVNDCYELKLLGKVRVRFSRIVQEFPYRAARVEAMPQDPYTETDPLVALERGVLLEALMRLLKSGADEWDRPPEASDSSTYEALVNGACMGLRMDPVEKQALLEVDSVIDRGRSVREMLERRLNKPPRPARGDGERN